MLPTSPRWAVSPRHWFAHIALIGLLACNACTGGNPAAAPSPTPPPSQSGLFSVTPAWARDAIFYQILPDRFNNGNHENDPPFVQPWGKIPEPSDHFGGDLEGILQRLPYLRALGVNALYLNPIFQSPSSHKYDVIDYFRVDPHLGSVESFQELVRQCHRQGMKVIIEGLFDHTSDQFFAFQEALSRGPQSPYFSWYTFYRWPISTQSGDLNYSSWWGNYLLPKLNLNNQEARSYLWKVVEYWTRDVGVDGWRLDAPTEIPQNFWVEFRQRVKNINPEAYIVGELWGGSIPWLVGDQFDAAMNYVALRYILQFFAFHNTDVDSFDLNLRSIRNRYPRPISDVMFNILGSHDTKRFLTECGGDLRKLKLAVLFQMTYPGTPVIYYGDEIGMEGDRDPDNRRTMMWEPNRQNRDLLEYYRKLIVLRKEHSALRAGDFQTVLRHNEFSLYGYLRSNPSEKLVIILNNGNHQRSIGLSLAEVGFPEAGEVQDLLSNKQFSLEQGKVTIDLPAYSGRILTAAP